MYIYYIYIYIYIYICIYTVYNHGYVEIKNVARFELNCDFCLSDAFSFDKKSKF